MDLSRANSGREAWPRIQITSIIDVFESTNFFHPVRYTTCAGTHTLLVTMLDNQEPTGFE
jgi:hypothetical protein